MKKAWIAALVVGYLAVLGVVAFAAGAYREAKLLLEVELSEAQKDRDGARQAAVVSQQRLMDLALRVWARSCSEQDLAQWLQEAGVWPEWAQEAGTQMRGVERNWCTRQSVPPPPKQGY